MKYTSRKNLKKPDGQDFYNIEDHNKNSDVLDDVIGELEASIKENRFTDQKAIDAVNQASDSGTEVNATHLGSLPAAAYAKVVQLQNVAYKQDLPTMLSELENDQDYVKVGDLPDQIPAGGTPGQVLKRTGTGIAWQEDENTTYAAATPTTNGIMSAKDKSKLDSIGLGAQPVLYGTDAPVTLKPGQLYVRVRGI